MHSLEDFETLDVATFLSYFNHGLTSPAKIVLCCLAE